MTDTDPGLQIDGQGRINTVKRIKGSQLICNAGGLIGKVNLFSNGGNGRDTLKLNGPARVGLVQITGFDGTGVAVDSYNTSVNGGYATGCGTGLDLAVSGGCGGAIYR